MHKDDFILDDVEYLFQFQPKCIYIWSQVFALRTLARVYSLHWEDDADQVKEGRSVRLSGALLFAWAGLIQPQRVTWPVDSSFAARWMVLAKCSIALFRVGLVVLLPVLKIVRYHIMIIVDYLQKSTCNVHRPVRLRFPICFVYNVSHNHLHLFNFV